jgi:PKD repeat protein
MYTDFIILSAWSVPDLYVFSTSTNLTGIPNTNSLDLLTEVIGVTGNCPLVYVTLSNTSDFTDGDIFTWNFGDVYNSTPVTATSLTSAYHSYIMPGSYSVTLTHTQILTSIDTFTGEIITTNVSQDVTKQVALLNELPPTAAISATEVTGVVPYTIQFTPLHTKAGSFAIDKIAWDFGDGSDIVNFNRYNRGFNPVNCNPSHTYTKASDETLTVSMTAFSNSTNTCSITSMNVGPFTLPSLTSVDFNLLKVRNTPYGTVYAADINNNLTFIKTN